MSVVVTMALAAVMPPTLTTAEAATQPAQRSVRLYVAPDSANRGLAGGIAQERDLISRLTATAGAHPAFDGTLRLSAKMEPRAVVEAAPLAVRLAQVREQDGWRRAGSVIWRTARTDTVASELSIPLEIAEQAANLRLLDYDEMQVDYKSFGDIGECVPRIELHAAARKNQERAGEVIVGESALPFGLRPVLSFDASGARWEPKGITYVLRRELGLAPDDIWRYAQDADRVVMQRRLDRRLDGIRAIEIAVAHGATILQVNLRVDRSGPGGESVVQFPNPRRITLADGSPGVRLDLRGELSRQLSGNDTAKIEAGSIRLKEVTIFIPGQVATIVAANALRRVTFLGSPDAEQPPQGGLRKVSLPAGVIPVPGGSRLLVDLRPLAWLGEMSMKAAFLKLTPASDAAGCAIGIDGARAANHFNGTMPRFAGVVESWARRWGAIPNAPDVPYGSVEGATFAGQMFFSDLTAAERAEAAGSTPSQPRRSEAKGTADRLPLALPYTVRTADGKPLASPMHLVSSHGATLSSDDELMVARVESDRLTLEGRSHRIDVAWPLDARVGETTLVYLAVPKGAEQIATVRLKLLLADGTTRERRVIPNELRRLDAGDARVRGLALQIVPQASPHQIMLDEIRLFDVKAVTYAEAFSMPAPSLESLRPLPVVAQTDESLLQPRAGGIAGLAQDGLAFSTTMDPPLDSVRAVRLKYRLPPSALDGEGCPIELRFNWANATMRRELCLAKESGELSIPLAAWVGESPRSTDLGALHSIDWTLRAADGHAGPRESFDLDFSVEGRSWASAQGRLRNAVLVQTAGAQIRAGPQLIDEMSHVSFRPSYAMPLDPRMVASMLQPDAVLQVPDHPLFTVDEITLLPKTALTDEQWAQLQSAPPAISSSARWTKLAIWGLVLGGLFAAWWRRWWSVEGLLDRGSGARQRVLAAARQRMVPLAPTAQAWFRRLNAVVVFLALVPGMWSAGRSGLSFRGLSLALACAIAAWAAWRIWRGWREGSTEAVPAILLASAALAVWSLGGLGSNPDALCGLAPLAAAAYLYASTPRGVQSLAKRGRWIPVICWAGVSAMLYALGMRYGLRQDENLFFTTGALCAAFMAGALVRELAPHMRRWPGLAPGLMREGGSVYFASGVILLVAIAALLALGMKALAENVATVAYFALVVGVVMEVVARRRATP